LKKKVQSQGHERPAGEWPLGREEKKCGRRNQSELTTKEEVKEEEFKVFNITS